MEHIMNYEVQTVDPNETIYIYVMVLVGNVSSDVSVTGSIHWSFARA